MGVQISDIIKGTQTELFCSDFGRHSNTEPTENETEVEYPRTKLVLISDDDCI